MVNEIRSQKNAKIERTTRAAKNATLELFAELGFRNITIKKISKRSGVDRSSIYRYWNNVSELAISALDDALGPVAEPPETGHVRNDLVDHYHRFARLLLEGNHGKFMPSLVEAAHNIPEFANLFEALVNVRSDPTRQILRIAIERGEISRSAPIDWVVDILGGLLHHRLLVTGTKLNEPGLIEWMVDCALSQVMTDHGRQQLANRALLMV